MIGRHDQHDPPNRRGRDLWIRVVLPGLVVALLIRTLFLVLNWESPYFSAPLVDAKDFHDKAVLIADGTGLPERPYDRPPLFTYFAAGLYRVAGVDLRVIIVAHHLLGVITVALTALLAARLFGPIAGLVAGLALGLGRLPLVLEGQLLNEPLQTFLIVLMMTLLVEAVLRARPGALITSAIVGGLSILARPTSALFVAPALVVVALWSRSAKGKGPDRRTRVFTRRTVGIAMLGFVIVAGLAGIRNRVVGKEWVPVSYNGGINFFVGNARDHDALMDIRPGLGWDRLVQSPRALEEIGVFRTDPWAEGFAAWDRRYYRAALADLLADPMGAMGRFARKATQFWSAREIDRNVHPAAFVPPDSIVGRVTLPFAFLGPPALAGLLLLFLHRPRGWGIIGGSVLGVWVTVILFFVTSRYRMPAYPSMAIAVGYLAAVSVQRWQAAGGDRMSRLRSLVTPVGLLAVSIALAVGDPGRAGDIAPARATFLDGLVRERIGDVSGALARYRDALGESPDDPDVLMNPTALLLGRGRAEAAAILAGRANEVLPDHPSPLFNLGLALAAQDQHARAAAAFARMTEVNPRDPRGFYQLGHELIRSGRPDAALRPLARSAALAPSMPLPRIERARAFLRLDRASEARAEIEVALRTDPRILGLIRSDSELSVLVSKPR